MLFEKDIGNRRMASLALSAFSPDRMAINVKGKKQIQIYKLTLHKFMIALRRIAIDATFPC